jgi:hypothetical protein
MSQNFSECKTRWPLLCRTPYQPVVAHNYLFFRQNSTNQWQAPHAYITIANYSAWNRRREFGVPILPDVPGFGLGFEEVLSPSGTFCTQARVWSFVPKYDTWNTCMNLFVLIWRAVRYSSYPGSCGTFYWVNFFLTFYGMSTKQIPYQEPILCSTTSEYTSRTPALLYVGYIERYYIVEDFFIFQNALGMPILRRST